MKVVQKAFFTLDRKNTQLKCELQFFRGLVTTVVSILEVINDQIMEISEDVIKESFIASKVNETLESLVRIVSSESDCEFNLQVKLRS